MPRGRQQELRLWLPPALYERVLRDAAVRGVSLSRCVRDRLEAHLALEAELLDVVERRDGRSSHGATGAALRLRLIEELEERLVATLGRQAESLERLVSDMRLVASAVDRAYAGMIAYVVLRDVRDADSRMKQLHEYQRHWREAVHRTWQEGDPVFALDEKVEDQKADGG
jgi:hypothetical protein